MEGKLITPWTVESCGRLTNCLDNLVALHNGVAGIKVVKINTMSNDDATSLAFGTLVQLEVVNIHLVVAKKPFKYLTFKTGKYMLYSTVSI